MRPAWWLAFGVSMAFVPMVPAAVCPSANGCDFWDDVYHEVVVYRVDAANIDVLILPGATPFALRDLTTARLAVQAWEDGVTAKGASWFSGPFELNVYVVGVDSNIPPSALTDPEIIVVLSEHNPVLLFGIGLQVANIPCLANLPLTVQPLPSAHDHGDGSQVLQMDCDTGGRTCVALNTNFLLGGRSVMYDVVAHEVGHCLGIGHVGDALDFDAKTVPAWDVMSYQFRASAVNCVSNLNVRAMEGVFAQILGQPTSAWLSPGQYYHMSPSQYSQVACATPPPGNLLGG